jgi:hypothetical protein
MSTKDQTSRGANGEKLSATEPRHVEDELITAQILQRLARIENFLVSLDSRFGEKLDTIDARLAAGRTARKVTAEKPNIRNWLNAQLTKGWISEAEIIEKTGWQTIGVRSYITKSRSLGLSVEEDVREGVPHYRFAR